MVRAALVVVTTLVIVWFMPRDRRLNFRIETGRPWHYNDLTAMFDFPVYKSDSTIQRERQEALRAYEPYYLLQKDIAATQVRRFMQEFGREQVTGGHDQAVAHLNSDYKRIIANRLNDLYSDGIVDTKEPIGLAEDSTRTLRRIDGKDVVSIAGSGIHTAREAYEQILRDPLLVSRVAALQELDLNEFIVPNLIYDTLRSLQSRQDIVNSVPKASGVVLRGQKIIDRGTIVDPQKALVLESYLREMDRRHETQRSLNLTVLGELLYVFLIILAFTIFLSMYRSDYFERMRSVGMIYVLIVLMSILASLLVSHNLLHVYILPFAIVPIFIRVFMDSRTAFVAHTALVLICACLLLYPLEFVVVQMAAGTAAIFSLRELSSRSQLFRTAVITTIAAMLANLAIYLIHNGDMGRLNASEYNYLLLCGIVIFCCYPLLYLVERTFGFISEISLIELSDMNKEPLRQLSEVAPGTFQHSIQVGNLAAEIARKIGASAQLVRTGALYHDIGKSVNPIYFTENQSGGISPHDHLTEIESAQMIVSHVTEGLKLAEKYNLPRQIRDFISTHHGLGKAKYFFVKYKNAHPDEPIDELLFTYPGPNPSTKEQAILMMADAVEAASRSLPDYTEQTIRTLVDRIIDQQTADGYFRDCPVTFRDLQYAKTVLIEKLKTIYHTRISYPEVQR